MKAFLRVFVFILPTLVLTQCEDEPDPNDSVNIPDSNFFAALIEIGVDANSDGEISLSEAEAITSLNIEKRDISDMTGIEMFVNLDTLSCYGNDFVTLDISKLVGLKILSTGMGTIAGGGTNLTQLDVSKNIELEALHCYHNKLTSIDLSKNIHLKHLSIGSNQFHSLDVSNNTDLEHLGCGGNMLTNLDVSNNPQLKSLDFERSSLTNIDLSNNVQLELLHCTDNQLTELDLSNNIQLSHLYCCNNLLTRLDLSNNTQIVDLFIRNMPSLSKVCVWTTPFPPEGTVRVKSDGSPNVDFTKDCSQ